MDSDVGEQKQPFSRHSIGTTLNSDLDRWLQLCAR